MPDLSPGPTSPSPTNPDPTPSPPLRSWQPLLRSRWWLGGGIGLIFALGQALEEMLLKRYLGAAQLPFDVALWGTMGGVVVWLSLTWASRQEARHQSELEAALRRQQLLNGQLQRTNAQLALLSEVNHRLAASASLDEIAAASLEYPLRLAPTATAAALWLADPSGDVLARTTGHPPARLQTLRAPYAAPLTTGYDPLPVLLTPVNDPDGLSGACLVCPLTYGSLIVGRVEMFLPRRLTLAADELGLLQTIGGEIGEAIAGARRRGREERSIYELEQAIAEERARIARDIHDGLAQTLAFRRMRIDLWLDWLAQDPARLRAELVEFKQLLREQIAELRRAIFALRPVTFDELGFVGGMHRYIHEFGLQQNWRVTADLSPIGPLLSPTLEAICYRMVQEALTNAAKHAQADTVSVHSAVVDGGLQLVIQDNGRGFDPGREEEADGEGPRLGLRQMRERLAPLHGRLTVFSSPDAGTELRIWIPLDAVRPSPLQPPAHLPLSREEQSTL